LRGENESRECGGDDYELTDHLDLRGTDWAKRRSNILEALAR
jgi:hypothetical protein